VKGNFLECLQCKQCASDVELRQSVFCPRQLLPVLHFVRLLTNIYEAYGECFLFVLFLILLFDGNYDVIDVFSARDHSACARTYCEQINAVLSIDVAFLVLITITCEVTK